MKSRSQQMRDMLPATSVEIAAELGISVKAANACLQDMKSSKRYPVARSDSTVSHERGRRGRAPYIWVLA